MFDIRKIPITLLLKIKPLYNLKSQYFTSVISKEGTITYKDSAPGSNFYFVIFSKDILENKDKITIEYLPSNTNSAEGTRISVDPGTILSRLNQWEDLIKMYSEFTLVEKEFISENQAQFYEEFDLVDDPSNHSPLNPVQILALDYHLDEIINNIDNYSNDYNAYEIEEIKHEAIDLKQQLGLLDKNNVVNKLTKIWAKMTKGGAEIIKEFLSETKKELIKTIVKATIEHGPSLLEQLANHHK